MEDISAIIVVKNNPPLLNKTIQSVKDLVNEIIIVDIGIDLSLRNFLKKDKKIKVIKFKEDIPYVELIREKTKKLTKNQYLIFLDPDEVLSDNLKKIIQKNYQKYDYFKIPRKNIIFGKWIRHSRWWPDYQIRVFNKNKVFWPTLIHRQPKVEGKGLVIEEKENLAIIHYNYENITQYLEKAIRYAKSEAQELIKEERIYTFKDTIKKGLNEFISRYFSGEGYKDGIHGFILAFLQLFYYFLVYFYYLEIKKFKTDEKIDESEFFKTGLKEILFWKKNKNLKEKFLRRII